MDFFLALLAILLIIAGFIGALLPGLPGPPLSFAGLVVLSFVSDAVLTSETLFNMGALALFITLLDYYIPIVGAKLLGGSRYGVWGSITGLLIALIVLPFAGIVIGPLGLTGLLIGPFAGALIGELLGGFSWRKALKAAAGTFAGFIAGTLIKLAYSAIAAWYLVKEMVEFL